MPEREPVSGRPRVLDALAGALVLLAVAASFALTGNLVRAVGTAAIAASVVLVVAIRRHRGLRIATGLHAVVPVAVPAVLSRLTEDSVHWRRSAILLAAACLAALLGALGVEVWPPIARGAAALARGLRAIVGWAIGIVVLLPLGIARVWRRHDPLGTGAKPGESAWHDVSAVTALPDRPFRLERSRSRTSPGRAALAAVPRAIGIVVLLLAVDFGVGWAWDQARGSEPPAPQVIYDNIGIAKPPEGVVKPSDPREDQPAVADDPWIHEWFQNWNTAPRYYWPYLLWRNAPYESTYLNIRGWERVSYRAEGVESGDAPDVGFFGGSTTYGIAQRDEHTIASEVARLAEAEGIPIIAHNYGVSGFVNWQEMLQFEQFVHDDALRPDLAVFYDGANELTAQSYGLVGVPSHTVLDEVAEQLGAPPDDGGEPPPEGERPIRDQAAELWATYREHSVTGQVARWLRGEAADAAPSQDSPTSEEAQASVDIYKRGRSLILQIAEEQAIPTLLFWQPRSMYEVEKDVQDQIDAPTIDISDALAGHQDVFIDGNHHNEEGAALVAAAIWEHLEPQVRAWYDAQD